MMKFACRSVWRFTSDPGRVTMGAGRMTLEARRMTHDPEKAEA
jgi:hypothetical protein